MLIAFVVKSIRRIVLELLSGNMRLSPPGEIRHVGIDPSDTLVPAPDIAVATHVPVPATVLTTTLGPRVILLIKQYVLSVTNAADPSGWMAKP